MKQDSEDEIEKFLDGIYAGFCDTIKTNSNSGSNVQYSDKAITRIALYYRVKSVKESVKLQKKLNRLTNFLLGFTIAIVVLTVVLIYITYIKV
ncbi:MAG: hypothetical protein ACLQG5_08855 [Methanobacterium sp.]